MKPLDYNSLPEWTYEPSGDVDGDPAYDGIIGTDHFVMEGGEEIACPPDESRARLMTVAPRLLAACRGALAALSQRATFPADIAYAKSILRDAIALIPDPDGELSRK